MKTPAQKEQAYKDAQAALLKLGLWFGMKAGVMIGLSLWVRKHRREELALQATPEAWLKAKIGPMVDEERNRARRP